MKKLSSILPVLLILSTLLVSGCEPKSPDAALETNSTLDSSVQVTDFNGSLIVLQKPAIRIVALAPHVVENVYSAGAGEQLVGVVAYSDYPEAATALPIVGGYAQTNLEKILQLQPDLVIAWESGNSDSSVARIKQLGFPVYVDQPTLLDDVAKSIRDIGILAGTSEVAEPVAEKYLNDINLVRQKNLIQQPVSTFYQVWNSPLRTINGGHIISNAIELCGGVNIYANEVAIAPIINIESILQRDPEAILASGMSDARPEWLDDWQAWPSLSSVKSDNLFFVDPDHIQRHTVRIIKGINTICEQLQQARDKRPTS
ncbi:MAG: iron complex transport system substrate-binding protein [Arenicella sp.]|jgi:iron complex transport system substrate-binding protein